MPKSLMKQTAETATGFWNDSCDLDQLKEALEHGAVGATSNPVIVTAVVKSAPETWNPLIDRLILEHHTANEDDIAWKLIEEIGKKAAELLMPEFKRSGGVRGRLSVQVDPRNFRDASAMLAQAEKLSGIAPNIAVKMPVVPAGLKAIEEATAKGMTLTPTVCFSVSQAVAAGEALERGLDRAAANGIDICQIRPCVAIMVGRLDDHLRRVMEARKLCIDPGCLEWAGIAVFKRAYAIFRKRGFRSMLLSAAYRNHMQWSEFIGGEVIVSIPHAWWKRFNASSIKVKDSIGNPVDPAIVKTLEMNFEDFRRAYEPEGMAPEEFLQFGATAHTLKQFIASYHELLELIRERMLR